MKRIISFISIFIIIFSIITTNYSFAEQQNVPVNDDDKSIVTLFNDQPNDGIPIYHSLDDIETENPIVTVENNTEVEIIYIKNLSEVETEILEEYSFVRYTSSTETSEDINVIEGFVHKDYIINKQQDNHSEEIITSGKTLDTDIEQNPNSEIQNKTNPEINANSVQMPTENIQQSKKEIKTTSVVKTTDEPFYKLALKQPVHVYSKTDRQSKVLKSYKYGHRLKMRDGTDEWYHATVRVNGKWEKGFIHHSDVGEKEEASSIYGVALRNSTNVYSDKNKTNILKSYKSGHILKYKAHSKDWFSAVVYIKGKRYSGYIHANDVESSISNPKTLYGPGIKHPTSVYQRANTSSKALKTYGYGSYLKFKEFTSHWYAATVKVNGKWEKGYIRKSHTGSMNTSLNGYAQKDRVHVYAKRSTNSKSLKSYRKGSVLKYKPYNRDWFAATVINNGKREHGFIRAKDVGKKAPTLYGYALGSPTYIYDKDNLRSKKIKSYRKGSQLKFKAYTKDWYKATVYIKGKKHSGYIHKNNVSFSKPKLNDADKLTTIENNDQLILVTSKGYNTHIAKIQTFERTKNGDWKRILSRTGYIGKNGFAQNKREGDGKSPTGKYTIGTAFGQKGDPGTMIPFRSITSDDVWVDDPQSKLYNTWQSRRKTSGQWKSAENMNHPLYKYGFVINYNTQRTPYKGSAIFMHVGTSYTVGCTATDEKSIISMMQWLDPNKNPVIIQTPESALGKY